MNVPDIPINVPVDDPNADTEWNDILRKHGVIPQKPPSPTPMIEEALSQARQLAHENRLEGKDLDELDALEDEEDEDFLESYRQKRIAELSKVSASSVYNQVYHLQKPDYAREVSEASQKSYVLVLLTASGDGNVESTIAREAWTKLANQFGDVKFCQMRGDMCIEGYPDRNCPTVLVYKDGDIKKQVVTLRELGGPRTSLPDMIQFLVNVGAVKSDDVRLKQEGGQLHAQSSEKADVKRSLRGRTTIEDDDSDWD